MTAEGGAPAGAGGRVGAEQDLDALASSLLERWLDSRPGHPTLGEAPRAHAPAPRSPRPPAPTPTPLVTPLQVSPTPVQPPVRLPVQLSPSPTEVRFAPSDPDPITPPTATPPKAAVSTELAAPSPPARPTPRADASPTVPTRPIPAAGRHAHRREVEHPRRAPVLVLLMLGAVAVGAALAVLVSSR